MASSFIAKVGGLVGRGREEYKPIEMEEASGSRASFDARPTREDRYKDTDRNDDEASVGLLSSTPELESGVDEKVMWPPEKKGMCVCCGINLRTPFMTVSIIALGAFIFGAYELLSWAFYEPPKGLEHLPAFGTSLGCLSSSVSYFYNNTKTHKFNVPIHPERFDHGFDIRGGAVGTITLLTSSDRSTNNVQYEVTLRSTDRDLVQGSIIKLPQLDSTGYLPRSEAVIATGTVPNNRPDACIRYDVKLYIPPSLKKLHVASHALAHVKIDKSAKINMEDLYVTLFSMDRNNVIQTSASAKADHISLEVTRGWIVGDVSIVDETSITTQRGDGVVHLDVYPEAPKNTKNPEAVSFQTTTGAGNTQVVYHKNKGAKRPIDNMHVSSKNGPLEFTYKDAGFNGLVKMGAKDFKATGLESFEGSKNAEDGQQNQEWTHYAGNKDGGDKISVSSRGWVGMYF